MLYGYAIHGCSITESLSPLLCLLLQLTVDAFRAWTAGLRQPLSAGKAGNGQRSLRTLASHATFRDASATGVVRSFARYSTQKTVLHSAMTRSAIPLCVAVREVARVHAFSYRSARRSPANRSAVPDLRGSLSDSARRYNRKDRARHHTHRGGVPPRHPTRCLQSSQLCRMSEKYSAVLRADGLRHELLGWQANAKEFVVVCRPFAVNLCEVQAQRHCRIIQSPLRTLVLHQLCGRPTGAGRTQYAWGGLRSGADRVLLDASTWTMNSKQSDQQRDSPRTGACVGPPGR